MSIHKNAECSTGKRPGDMIDAPEMPVMKKVKQWLDNQFEAERLTTSASSVQAMRQKRPGTAMVDGLMDACKGNVRNAQHPRYASGFSARDCNCDSCQQNARRETANVPAPPVSNNCNCDKCRKSVRPDASYIPPKPSKCNCDDCRKKCNEEPLPRNCTPIALPSVRRNSWHGRTQEMVAPLSVSQMVDCSCDACRGRELRRLSSSTSVNKCSCDACNALKSCHCGDCNGRGVSSSGPARNPNLGGTRPFINNLPSQCSSCGCEVPFVQGVFNLEYMGCSLLKVKYLIPKNGLESSNMPFE